MNVPKQMIEAEINDGANLRKCITPHPMQRLIANSLSAA